MYRLALATFLIFAAPLQAAGRPGLCRIVYLAFSNHDIVYDDNPGRAIALAALDPALADYERRYVTKPVAHADRERVKLLHRLGVLPGEPPGDGSDPRFVAYRQNLRAHADGGTYHRLVDQYGDVYGTAPGALSTIPEFSRVFNLPRQHAGLPGEPARFLRETAAGFPVEKLTKDDVHLLEPLPQRDPLGSYLGCALMRIYTMDSDKPMPEYSATVAPQLEGGRNYFRRTDGTYYIYDLPRHRLSGIDYRTHAVSPYGSAFADNMNRIDGALRGAPDKAKARELYLDSLYAFPAIGRHEMRRHIEADKRDRAAYEKALAGYGELEKSLVFRFFSYMATTLPPRSPILPLDSPYSYVNQIEGYFLMPLFVEKFHREMGHDPALVAALAKRNAEYRQTLLPFLDRIAPELPPNVVDRLRVQFTALAEGKPPPKN